MLDFKLKGGEILRCKKSTNNVLGEELFTINKNYKLLKVSKNKHNLVYYLKANIDEISIVSIGHPHFIDIFDFNIHLRKRKIEKINSKL